MAAHRGVALMIGTGIQLQRRPATGANHIQDGRFNFL